MSDYNTAGVSSRIVTAFFDSREAADRAAGQLASLGVGRDQIRITEGSGASSGAAQPQDKGFWESLKDLFLPEEDRHSYAEGLRRGGYLLSARIDEGHYDRAVELLDADGSVNMDEREANWRSSGWGGYQRESQDSMTRNTSVLGAGATTGGATSTPASGGTSTAGASTTGATLAANSSMGEDGGAASSGAGMASGGVTGAATSQTGSTRSTELQSGQDETIPVYEETAKVGKRDVSHGRVRLRSYVVETPVNEQVNLRNEQVQVERRPVDRSVSPGDAAFQNRVIEAEERTEEPVVSKETRVKEEIGLRKSVENQTETVSDTVRRTQVDVQDDRGASATGTARGMSDTGRISDHMDVVAADGTKIGAVDHLEGDKIKLAKSASPDGQHHFIPLDWVDHVDSHVHLKKSAAEARASW